MAVAAENFEDTEPLALADLMLIGRFRAGIRALYVNHPKPLCYMAGEEINNVRFDHGVGPVDLEPDVIYPIEGGDRNEIFW